MSESSIQGEFEHHVLLTAARIAPDAFTAAIVTELEARTAREVSPSAVYVALRRLEAKKLVRSEKREEDAPGQLRERRYFEPTEQGLRALRASRTNLQRLWEGMESVLGEEG